MWVFIDYTHNKQNITRPAKCTLTNIYPPVSRCSRTSLSAPASSGPDRWNRRSNTPVLIRVHEYTVCDPPTGDHLSQQGVIGKYLPGSSAWDHGFRGTRSGLFEGTKHFVRVTELLPDVLTHGKRTSFCEADCG